MSDTPRTDEAEFDIYDGDDYFAGVSGQRERVWGEAMRYAMQCEKPRIEEVARTPAPMGEEPPPSQIHVISDGMPKWRDADSDPPADAQQVLAGWFGPSCVEGMETLIYHAADAPDSREAWQDVHGEDRDPPTHWTIVEAPK